MAEAGTLHDAFIDELRDTYDAERQLTKALPKLAKAAASPDCARPSRRTSRRRRGRSNAWNRSSRASTKRSAASTATGSPASSKKASRSWKRISTTTTMDACLIAAGQRAEHYEMAAYGTLVAWARAMGHTEAADLLQETLDEEKAADEKLSSLAEGGINQSAAEATHSDEDEEAVAVGGAARGKRERPTARVALVGAKDDGLAMSDRTLGEALGVLRRKVAHTEAPPRSARQVRVQRYLT